MKIIYLPLLKIGTEDILSTRPSGIIFPGTMSASIILHEAKLFRINNKLNKITLMKKQFSFKNDLNIELIVKIQNKLQN